MQSVQESKQELEAAIRYAENAISSANQTIESMTFRQEMAQKQYSEQTGREQTLQAQVALLEERIADTQSDMVGDASTIKTLKEEREMLEKNVQYLRDENERLKREKEASSGPCGCQAYRDLEEARGRAEGEVELLQRTISDLDTEVKALKEANMSLVCDNDDLKDDLKGQRDFLCECFKEFTEKLGTIGFEGA